MRTVTTGLAIALGVLLWAGAARADSGAGDDFNAAHAALKKKKAAVADQPNLPGTAVDESGGDAATGSPKGGGSAGVVALSTANYNSVVSATANVMLGFYTNAQLGIWRPEEEAMASLAAKYGDKAVFAKIEHDYAKLNGIEQNYHMPEVPPLPYFLLIQGRKVVHRFDVAERKDHSMSSKGYFEAAINSCLVPLGAKPEPPPVPCNP